MRHNKVRMNVANLYTAVNTLWLLRTKTKTDLLNDTQEGSKIRHELWRLSSKLEQVFDPFQKYRRLRGFTYLISFRSI